MFKSRLLTIILYFTLVILNVCASARASNSDKNDFSEYCDQEITHFFEAKQGEPLYSEVCYTAYLTEAKYNTRIYPTLAGIEKVLRNPLRGSDSKKLLVLLESLIDQKTSNPNAYRQLSAITIRMVKIYVVAIFNLRGIQLYDKSSKTSILNCGPWEALSPRSMVLNIVAFFKYKYRSNTKLQDLNLNIFIFQWLAKILAHTSVDHGCITTAFAFLDELNILMTKNFAMAKNPDTFMPLQDLLQLYKFVIGQMQLMLDMGKKEERSIAISYVENVLAALKYREPYQFFDINSQILNQGLKNDFTIEIRNFIFEHSKYVANQEYKKDIYIMGDFLQRAVDEIDKNVLKDKNGEDSAYFLDVILAINERLYNYSNGYDGFDSDDLQSTFSQINNIFSVLLSRKMTPEMIYRLSKNEDYLETSNFLDKDVVQKILSIFKSHAYEIYIGNLNRDFELDKINTNSIQISHRINKIYYALKYLVAPLDRRIVADVENELKNILAEISKGYEKYTAYQEDFDNIATRINNFNKNHNPKLVKMMSLAHKIREISKSYSTQLFYHNIVKGEYEGGEDGEVEIFKLSCNEAFFKLALLNTIGYNFGGQAEDSIPKFDQFLDRCFDLSPAHLFVSMSVPLESGDANINKIRYLAANIGRAVSQNDDYFATVTREKIHEYPTLIELNETIQAKNRALKSTKSEYRYIDYSDNNIQNVSKSQLITMFNALITDLRKLLSIKYDFDSAIGVLSSKKERVFLEGIKLILDAKSLSKAPTSSDQSMNHTQILLKSTLQYDLYKNVKYAEMQRSVFLKFMMFLYRQILSQIGNEIQEIPAGGLSIEKFSQVFTELNQLSLATSMITLIEFDSFSIRASQLIADKKYDEIRQLIEEWTAKIQNRVATDFSIEIKNANGLPQMVRLKEVKTFSIYNGMVRMSPLSLWDKLSKVTIVETNF